VLADAGQRLALRQDIQRLRPDIGHDLGTLRRELIRQLLRRSDEDADLVEPAYEVFYTERLKVELFDDARPALAWLSARFPLVAVSNGNADVHRVGIGEYFKDVVSAQEFGVGKPDPRIFHAAAAAAGVQSHEVLHVGDDAALDVLGGLNAGMQTVWVNRARHDWTHEARPHATVDDMAQLCALLEGATQG
jgi:HAD superfamily hydrolase (TIGR01509 family)